MKNKTSQNKSQSKEVTEAIRLLALKYDVGKATSIERVRKIVAKAVKKSGKTLSQMVVEMREEER